MDLLSLQLQPYTEVSTTLGMNFDGKGLAHVSGAKTNTWSIASSAYNQKHP